MNISLKEATERAEEAENQLKTAKSMLSQTTSTPVLVSFNCLIYLAQNYNTKDVGREVNY